jgi:hypothetical protein
MASHSKLQPYIEGKILPSNSNKRDLKEERGEAIRTKNPAFTDFHLSVPFVSSVKFPFVG